MVRFPVLEALPEQLEYVDPFKEINYFKIHPLTRPGKEFYLGLLDKLKIIIDKFSYRLRFQIAKFFCNNLNLETYFRGHFVGKSAVRTNASIIGFRAHYPIPVKGETLNWSVADQVKLLHFNCCGFESWRVKWQRRYDGSAVASRLSNLQSQELRQFTQYMEHQEPNKLPELYKSLYFLSSQEKKILIWLNLLQANPSVQRTDGRSL